MPFVPFLYTCEVHVRYLYLGQQVENILYFIRPTGMGETHVRLITDGVADWWNARIKQWQHSWLELTEVYGRRLNNDSDYQYTNLTYAGVHGTKMAGEGAPGNVALSVCFRTKYAGRSFRGRNYTTAISTDDFAGNIIDDAYAAGIQLAYSKLLYVSPYLNDTIWWVVASRRYNKQWRVQGVTTIIEEVLLVNKSLDSMRRRLEGRGR